MLFRRDRSGGDSSAEPVLVEADSPIVGAAGFTAEALGIETLGGAFTSLIKSESPVPCTVSETFSTAADRQKEIIIILYRGSDKKVKRNHFLGQFGIGGIVPARHGEPKVEITFHVSELREIRLSARNAASGEPLPIRRIPKR